MLRSVQLATSHNVNKLKLMLNYIIYIYTFYFISFFFYSLSKAYENDRQIQFLWHFY